MLTRAGVVALLASVVVLVGGRAFGLPELFVIGSGGLLLVAAAVSYVAVRRVRFEVVRRLSPPRVHAGDPCRVDLALTNVSRFRSPTASLHDDVFGTRGVDLMVAPLRSGHTTRAVYRLPTERRGLVTVGPLELTVSDPFGLARASIRTDESTALLVYPRLERLDAVARSTGSDIERRAVAARHVAPLGDEFHALREFQLGDDLRRIHWPSSARHDDLMVRQDELPWHGRVTVVLDARRDVGSGAISDPVFEAMVSAAGSIAATSIARTDQVRFVGTDGFDSGFGSGSHHLDRILGHLAVVDAHDEPPEGVVDHLAGTGTGGVLVSIGPSADLDLALAARVGGSYGRRIAVGFSEDAPPRRGGAARAGNRSVTIVPVTIGSDFASIWRRTLEAGRGRR